MNRPPRADEAVSPFECQCVGMAGCYELIPAGMWHECDPRPFVAAWRAAVRWVGDHMRALVDHA